MTHTSRTIRNLLAVIAVAAVPVTALSACGGGDDSSSASTTAEGGSSGSSTKSVTAPDPCTLVTEAQATTAAGIAVTKSEVSGSAGTPSCYFSSETAKESVDVQADASSASFDSMKKIAGTQGVAAIEPVSGVGDDAYVDFSLGETRPSLRVSSGGVYFFINVRNDALSPEQLQANEQALAQQVVAAAG